MLEVSLSGLAVPVNIELMAPSTSLAAYDKRVVEFGQCKLGSNTNLTLTVSNRSSALPATFQFRRTAHFAVQPYCGLLKPGKTLEVVATFAPNQLGE